MDSKQHILQTQSLEIGYLNKPILKDINVSVEKGKMICLLGQNGVGKSTLIRTLADLQEPINGTVLLEKTPLTQMDRKERAKKLGIVTTEKIGTANMSVRDLVALGRFPYTDWWGKEKPDDTEMIEKAIAFCKINFLEKAKLGEISDGQFQKVMIARVLAQDTDIILLDEPTAHLDIVNRHEIFGLLAKIKAEENKAILISTHELDLSVQYADELWLMDFNQPIITGAPQDLIQQKAIQKIFHLDGQSVDISHLLKRR